MMPQQAAYLPQRLISIKRHLAFIARCRLTHRGPQVDLRVLPPRAKRSGAHHDPGAGSVTNPIRVRPAFAATLMTRATLS